MKTKTKLEMFANEIGCIKNDNLQSFAKILIANADDYFFTVPASSSGRYHPSFSLGDGGLVRHTQCVVYWAICQAESLNFNDEDTDLLIIAALMHDIKKQGNNEGSTVREHPLLAADYVMDVYENNTQLNLITIDQVIKICDAVRSHMGKWEYLPQYTRGKEPYPMPSNDFEKALQSADYIASRKAVLEFDFSQTQIRAKQILKEKKEININVDAYTLQDLEVIQLPFGKHKGKMFKEVLETGYLDWMTEQTNFSYKTEQRLAKRYLELVQGS